MRWNDPRAALTSALGLWRAGGVLLMLLALTPAWTLAAPKNEDLPILIEADSADINDRKGVSIYRGDPNHTQHCPPCLPCSSRYPAHFGLRQSWLKFIL